MKIIIVDKNQENINILISILYKVCIQNDIYNNNIKFEFKSF